MSIIAKLDPQGFFSHHLFKIHKKTVDGAEVKVWRVLDFV